MQDGSLVLRRATQKHLIKESFGILPRTRARPVNIEEMNEAIAKGWAGKQ